MLVCCFTWFSLLPLLKYCCCHWLIFAIVDNYLIEHRSCNLNSWVRGEPWVSLGTPIHMGSVPCCQVEGEQLHSMASLLLPVVPGHSRLLRQVDSVCWGCCATGTWQIWQLGSYVHPSGWQRCKDSVLLAFENAPQEGLWTLLLVLTLVESLPHQLWCFILRDLHTLMFAKWWRYLKNLRHAVICSRFLLYCLATRSKWKWEMQNFVQWVQIKKIKLGTLSSLQRRH